MLRFSLIGLLGLVTFAALASGALVGSAKNAAASTAPWWWASGVATGTVLLLAFCLFGALFGAGRRRAAFGGALLAGTIYWLIVFSPSFRDGIGSKLVTSRLIRLAEIKMAVEAQPAPTYNAVVTSFPYPLTSLSGTLNATGNSFPGNATGNSFPGNAMDGTSSTIFLGTTIYTSPLNYTSLTLPARPTEAAHLGTPLQEVAHYLLIWPLALVGGVVAGCIYALSRRRETGKA